MEKYNIIEMCPHCEAENEFPWDVETMGYVATCQHCGKKLMLCDECMHADDNPGMRCDWRNECGGICFRDNSKKEIAK